jgi:hypothetical protein
VSGKGEMIDAWMGGDAMGSATGVATASAIDGTAGAELEDLGGVDLAIVMVAGDAIGMVLVYYMALPAEMGDPDSLIMIGRVFRCYKGFLVGAAL